MSIIKMITKNFFHRNAEQAEQPPFDKLFAQFSHDLKGNLIAIRSCTGNIKKIINTSNVQLKISNIERALTGIDKKINHSITLINMITLFSTPACHWPSEVSILSITDCIQHAIQDYPFSSDKHADLISMVTPSVDFSFTGNKNLIHGVFYCLINNAMHSFYNRGSSEALVELISNNRQNKVQFKFSANINTDTTYQHNLFALGTPEKPGNGFNVIAGMLKSMNANIDFKWQMDGTLIITLTFMET